MEERVDKTTEEERALFLPKAELVEWLESEEYQTAMRQTFETRARVGGVMGRFFMNTTVGQYLLSTQLFTHPIIREKERQEEQIKKRAEQLEMLLPNLDRNSAELMARVEPHFQPRDSVQVILESRIDDLAFYKRISKHDYNANRDIDYAFQISLKEVCDRLGPLSQERFASLNERFPDILIDRKITYIRDRFYQLLADRDWTGFLDLVASHYNNLDVGVQMACWIFEHRQYIFPNKHFRAVLFNRLMTMLIQQGENTFMCFDKLWLDIGLDMRDESEKKQLAKTAFPLQEWYQLMDENPKRYFEIQGILRSYGICPG